GGGGGERRWRVKILCPGSRTASPIGRSPTSQPPISIPSRRLSAPPVPGRADYSRLVRTLSRAEAAKLAASATSPALRLLQQAGHRLHRGAVRKDVGREQGGLHAQVVLEQTFEHRAQIGGRLEVASLVQLGRLEPRPGGDDAPAFERAAGEQRHRRGAVIGAIGAVDAGG